jgi:large subunit ribosomal protein L10
VLTRTQKKEQVAKAADEIKKSKTLIFADFSGVGVENLRGLKRDLREAGAKFTIVKKRLLNLALQRADIDFDAMQFEGPVGTVFVPEDITSVASKMHKFGISNKTFQVVGAYDVEKNSFLNSDEFTVIAKLPSRDILIAQIMGGITGPLRAFMSIVKQLSEKSSTNNESVTSELIDNSGEKKEEVKGVPAPPEASADAEILADKKEDNPPSPEATEDKETVEEKANEANEAKS